MITGKMKATPDQLRKASQDQLAELYNTLIANKEIKKKIKRERTKKED